MINKMARFNPYPCQAAVMARSLLELWRSGDQPRLLSELEHVSLAPEPAEQNDESDRIDLLKCMAWRMKEAADLFAPRSESPRIGIWLDLLDHLSASVSSEVHGSGANQRFDLYSAPSIPRYQTPDESPFAVHQAIETCAF